MNDRICFYAKPFSWVKSYMDMIDLSVKYGFKYIEGFNMLDFEVPDLDAAKKIREYADTKDIKFSCFSVYINLVGEDSAKQLIILKKYADIASILGSPYFHHTIAGEFSNPDKVLPFKEDFFQKGIAAVREVYDYCESLGMKAIYEEQGYLFNGIEGYGRFLSEVGRDVGVLADFANICQMGETAEAFIGKFGDRVVHAHIKNVILKTEKGDTGLKTLNGDYMHEVSVSDGDVHISKGVELLKSFGYNGYFGIEYGAPEGKDELMEKSLEFVDSVL